MEIDKSLEKSLDLSGQVTLGPKGYFQWNVLICIPWKARR